jgi:hypothetical protein
VIGVLYFIAVAMLLFGGATFGGAMGFAGAFAGGVLIGAWLMALLVKDT